MAVTQISQIQVRYGLQEDIGTLAAGEFAWAIDTQRLFIGNGTLVEGAPISGMTEIMTGQFEVAEGLGPYIYRGLLGGYQVVTGPADSDIVRNLQDKVDDFVNVRDFGVSSTGNSDQTQDLQRAIYELYGREAPVTPQRTRRALRFNGGTYRIDGEIKIPPYVTLIGEGIDSVKIILNGPAAKLVTTTGSDADEEVALGEYPAAVHLKGMTIQRSNDNDFLVVDGSNNIVFEDVAFVGPRVRPNTIGAGSCVVVRSTVRDTANIHFNRCRFSGVGYAALFESALKIENVTFSGCTFRDLWSAIRMDDLGGTVHGVKIRDSIFIDLYSTAIYGSAGATGIISTGNNFVNCASGYEGDITPMSQWQPIIVFQSDGNYSFMDVFARNIENSRLFPRVSAEMHSYAYMSLDEYFALGTANYYAGIRLGVQDGSTFSLPTVAIKHGLINYSLERGTMTRTGVINFSSKNGNVVWSDDYTESDDLGVLFNLSVDTGNNNIIKLNGITTAIGAVTKISFDIKNLA
jgi:hypothetical protein